MAELKERTADNVVGKGVGIIELEEQLVCLKIDWSLPPGGNLWSWYVRDRPVLRQNRIQTSLLLFSVGLWLGWLEIKGVRTDPTWLSLPPITKQIQDHG